MPETSTDMDPFKVLGLQQGKCTEAEVTQAYRKLALTYHPDKAGPSGQERMKEINQARDMIVEKKLWLKSTPEATSPSARKTRKEAGKRRNEATKEPQPDMPPQSTSDAFENLFWNSMPDLMGEIWLFMLEQEPSVTGATREQWFAMRELYESIKLKLKKSPMFRDRRAVCRAIGRILHAIKCFKTMSAETYQEACKIGSLWSLRYTMSTFDWCRYDGADQAERDKIMMEDWLQDCLPTIEYEWKVCARETSFEDVMRNMNDWAEFSPGVDPA